MAEFGIPSDPRSESDMNGESERSRRLGINNLAINFLQKKNGQIEEELVRMRFQASVTADMGRPLEEIHDSTVDLIGYNDALAIAKFYTENNLLIPQDVLIVSERKMLKLPDDPKRKVLVYIDQGFYDGEKNESWIFSDKRKRMGRKDIEQTPPDVFLKVIESQFKHGSSDSTKHYKKSFAVSGCENLLINAFAYPSNIENIDLSCIGQMAILPGATLRNKGRFSLNAGGDVLAYPRSQVGVQSIKCANYYNRGELVYPQNDTSMVECSGEFIDQGGTRATFPNVVIHDNKIGERVAEDQQRAAILASEEGFPYSQVKVDNIVHAPEGTSKRELEEIFDRLAQPITEIRREDGVVIRGYNYPINTYADLDKYTKWIAHAEAAGWKITREKKIGEIMSVTFNRSND